MSEPLRRCGGARVRRRVLWLAAGLALWTGIGIGCSPHEPATKDANAQGVSARRGSDPEGGVGEGAKPTPLSVSAQDTPARYVGRKACAACHAEAMAEWSGSDHDRAMEVPTPESVEGDFEGRRFQHFGVTTRFLRVGESYRIRTEGPSGVLESYPVKYTFGVRPLQQYLLEIEPGRLQAFSLAWDTEAREWFSLYPDEPIPPDDALHWTRPAQNWNRNCAECHSTGVAVNYDAEERRYRTTWRELDVSCEACHGPGGQHLAWAKAHPAAAEAGSDASREGDDRGLRVRFGPAAPKDRDRRAQAIELDVCAPCHSRRSRVYPGGPGGLGGGPGGPRGGPGGPGGPCGPSGAGGEVGSRFLDYFRPALLTPELYRADGQIQGEVFVYGSFLQSRMYAEGVRCSHCHDPHSTQLVAEGNALCTQCHEPAPYDAPAHHHHARDSAGAQCVNCHMTSRTYMGVDARRDHGFHLPRPDLSDEFEPPLPNACSGCHERESLGDGDSESGIQATSGSADRAPRGSNSWSAEWIEEWFGKERPDDRHAARALGAGRAGEPGAEVALASLVANHERPGIVRATALELLSRYPGLPASLRAARAGLTDSDPLVRAAAAGSLAGLAGEEFVALLAPLLCDPVRSVRMEAARQLAPTVAHWPDGDPARVRRFGAALDEYLEGQSALASWPEAQLNVAVIHEQLGRRDSALQAYQRALALDPDYLPAHYNLALLYDAEKKPQAAEAELRRVLELDPEFADAHYSLGLLLAANPERLEQAAVALARAAELAPERARVLYNAGIAQQTLGRVDRAEGLLRAALTREPGEADFAAALAILYVQQGRRGDALPLARKWLELAPTDRAASRLLRELERNGR